LQLSKGILKLLPRKDVQGHHLPIDSFFQSLAEDKKELAIGFVLSGIASDGSIGLREIKFLLWSRRHPRILGWHGRSDH
jgi:two-component system CheB/CheR fusion protein